MIRRLGYYCRKILPTVLDDALSYYEQLCKVVLTCNECVDAVNGLTNSVNGLGEEVNNTNLVLENLGGTVEALGRGLDAVDAETRRVAVLADNSVQKNPNGTVTVGSPVSDGDAVNLKYFRDNAGGSSAEMVLKKVRISAPSGSGYVEIDSSKLSGIVADTPIWVFYQMPDGEFYGPPSYTLSVGGTDLTSKRFGDYHNAISAELFSTAYPLVFRAFFDGTSFFVPYADNDYDSRVARGANITVGAQGATVTSLGYADIVYFKEG